jgi:4-hydroxy-tetrahydrodipicolinate synthase
LIDFKRIADVGLPMVIYNVPVRTGINVTPKTVAWLSEMPAVAAVKEERPALILMQIMKDSAL